MSNLIDNVIRSSMLNMHVYSKVKFDNVKDTTELLKAVNQSSELLVDAVKHSLSRHVEQLVAEKIEASLAGTNAAVVRIGDKYYSVKEEK